MEVTLMHKDTQVSRLEMVNGQVTSVAEVYSQESMPLGTLRNGYADPVSMNRWWNGRGIPQSREGLDEALKYLGVSGPSELLSESMGLSLSDHYWIRKGGSQVCWDDVDFFDNGFSEDLGDLLFGREPDSDTVFDPTSPDVTTDGVLKKRWKIIDGNRCLVKGGSTPFCQETFNEVVASTLMGAMPMDHVDYSLLWSDGESYSVCRDFIDVNTELVTAHQVIISEPKDNRMSYYDHYIEVCRKHGVDVRPSLDRMLVLDYLIDNGDRHTNNFGIFRDADTLEWIGPAPVYDSGSSLGYNVPTEHLSNMESPSKPFKKRFREQLDLLGPLDWFDRGSVDCAMDDIRRVMDGSRGRIGPERREALVGLIQRRADHVESLKSRRRQRSVISSMCASVSM
ncbi:MAG: HipA domain-containing protein [Candidatus Methanomethylophilaceae archaeon]|nr:HipA domain-containing protein [Candidatus Methanomethylophilaceae archaeon]